MNKPIVITVRMTTGTYIARCQGKTGSATAGPEQAAALVAGKVLGNPDASIDLESLPEKRYGYTRWAVAVSPDPYAPETIAIGDIVELKVPVNGYTGWECEVTKVFPRARRFRVKGFVGAHTKRGDEIEESLQVDFDAVQLLQRAS